MDSTEYIVRGLKELITSLVTNINLSLIVFSWILVYLTFIQAQNSWGWRSLTYRQIIVIGGIGGGLGSMFYSGVFILMAIFDSSSLLIGVGWAVVLSLVLFGFGAIVGIPLAFMHVGILKVYRNILLRKNKPPL